MKRIIILAPLALLAGCGQPKPLLILPPATLAQCADAPAIPVLPPPGVERDRVTLKLWLDERAAGADCRADVHGLDTWMKEAK